MLDLLPLSLYDGPTMLCLIVACELSRVAGRFSAPLPPAHHSSHPSVSHTRRCGPLAPALPSALRMGRLERRHLDPGVQVPSSLTVEWTLDRGLESFCLRIHSGKINATNKT